MGSGREVTFHPRPRPAPPRRYAGARQQGQLARQPPGRDRFAAAGSAEATSSVASPPRPRRDRSSKKILDGTSTPPRGSRAGGQKGRSYMRRALWTVGLAALSLTLAE